MAKKYIDAEAAFKVMRDISNHYHETYVSNARAETAEWCLKKLKELPAVDVVEVRHGRWVADKEDVEWGNHLIHYRCSECKERPHFDKDKYKFILSPYCPNCGAKMDKEAEDD